MTNPARIVLLSIAACSLCAAASAQSPVPRSERPADMRSKYYRTPGFMDVSTKQPPAGIIRERDVPVTMRDGSKLYVNVHRPEYPARFPVVLSASHYGKDTPAKVAFQAWQQASGFDIGRLQISGFTAFEAPDPGFWVPRGYVVVHADVRGAFRSEGNIGPYTRQDTFDLYDLIEWAAIQSWSDGNVGLNGVSTPATSQWFVAALQPPHLRAIIPWEGLTDHYRDSAFHGGVPETRFRISTYSNVILANRNRKFGIAEEYPKLVKANPLFNEIWRTKAAELEKISVPALVCASWSSQGDFSRGAFEGYKRIASRNKWLFNHGREQWAAYYAPEALDLQLRFFDRFLKRVDNGMDKVPRVRLEVRKTREEYAVQFENEWPLARTRYLSLYLDAANRTLRTANASTVSRTSYVSDQGGKLELDYRFDRETRLIGNMKLKLWVSAEDADDMDLFAGIRKLDKDGQEVYFFGFGGNPNDIVSRGWLRVSAREKDEQRSTLSQPFLKHEKVKKLSPGEIVPAEIEILPSGTLFEAGSTLRLVIQGTDIVPNRVLRHDASVNKGRHTIYSGGQYDSYLLVPVVAVAGDQSKSSTADDAVLAHAAYAISGAPEQARQPF